MSNEEPRKSPEQGGLGGQEEGAPRTKERPQRAGRGGGNAAGQRSRLGKSREEGVQKLQDTGRSRQGDGGAGVKREGPEGDGQCSWAVGYSLRMCQNTRRSCGGRRHTSSSSSSSQNLLQKPKPRSRNREN